MVEHDVANVGVAGSNPVSRSMSFFRFIFLIGDVSTGPGTFRRAALCLHKFRNETKAVRDF